MNIFCFMKYIEVKFTFSSKLLVLWISLSCYLWVFFFNLVTYTLTHKELLLFPPFPLLFLYSSSSMLLVTLYNPTSKNKEILVLLFCFNFPFSQRSCLLGQLVVLGDLAETKGLNSSGGTYANCKVQKTRSYSSKM